MHEKRIKLFELNDFVLAKKFAKKAAILLEPKIFIQIKQEKQKEQYYIDKNEIKVLLLSYFNIGLSILNL